jgi:hypothetical protein
MIAELNQTADRNIGLLESRLTRLQEMIDKADGRLSLLKKETDKEKRGSVTYSRVRPRILHQEEQGREQEPQKASGAQQDLAFESGGQAAGGSFSRTGPAEGSPGRDIAAAGWQSPAPQTPAPPQGGVESAAGSESPRSKPEGRSREGAQKEESAGRPDKRARVIELHRQGISPDVIASRVDSTIGEVELIITMAEGRKG